MERIHGHNKGRRGDTDLCPVSTEILVSVLQGFGVFPEVIQTYYHTDQVGNVTWTTDNTGRATGYRSYLPNGELLQARNRKAPPLEYAFNGKERDASSGLDYFGARYLDAEASLWLSPDPLDGAFPGHNPYAFALHNPLRFADPDGREAWDYFSTELEAAKDFAQILVESAEIIGADLRKPIEVASL